MKRADITKEAGIQLIKLGFGRGTFTWATRGGLLVVLIGNEMRKFKFKAGMTKREFAFQMGRIAGLVEAFPFPAAPRSNGHITADDWNAGPQLNWLPA